MFPAFNLTAACFVSVLFINVLWVLRRDTEPRRGGVAEWLKALVC